MRRTDGQSHEIESRFSHPFPHTTSSGQELDLQHADGPADDAADGELSAWESAWVDLGGEG